MFQVSFVSSQRQQNVNLTNLSNLLLMLSILRNFCCARFSLKPSKEKDFNRVGSALNREFTAKNINCVMENEKLSSHSRKQAYKRVRLVSSCSMELLEIHSEEPLLHILVIPGNPGVASFYKDFIEAMYVMLGGIASVTVIGHIAHTRKDWEHGKMFSLQEQINHKVDFIRQELEDNGPPLILVGHSIGSYICLEVFKQLPLQFKFVIGLYPFLSVNRNSSKQSLIGRISRSSLISSSISSFVSSLGLFPVWIQRYLVKIIIGQSWSSTAIDATCSDLLKYHTMRNVLYMAMTEFTQLSEELDWSFMKMNEDKIAFLFGIDDHWGPLSLFQEISRQAPRIALSIEEEGHTHAYCCTEEGSVWVARHVVNLIKNQNSN